MSSSSWSFFLGALCAVVLSSVPASAQVCGDADGNGQVSVTDGVQALRAAATLSTTCTAARCDVDGNGSVSVTDGVNILRKAASLPITENCPSSTQSQVEDLLQNTLPIFGQLTKVGGGAAAQIAETLECANEGGFVEVTDEFGELTLTYMNCQFDAFLFDGSVSVDEEGGFFFDIGFVDLTTDEFSSIFGDLSFRSTSTGGVFGGNLDVSIENLGEVSVVFEDVETDEDENFVGGSLLFDATDSGIAGVVGIRVGFAPSADLPVSVILDDQTVVSFNFNTFTGELTPVSN